MNIKDFKINRDIKYGNFPLAEYVYNEIVVQDTYGLNKLKEKYDNVTTILDIGGNIGVFSVFARELFPKARIISLEAVHDTYCLLKENTKNYEIETYNIALGDGSNLYIYIGDHSGANRVEKQRPLKSKGPTTQIQSKTLKHIFDDLKIESPYVIKADIEGSEAFLYNDKTCIEILKNCCYFTFEFHSSVPRSNWDRWLINIFGEFDIDGMGKRERFTTYRIIKKDFKNE